jgi:hypothetical protein
MTPAENKTQPVNHRPEAVIEAVGSEIRRRDGFFLLDLFGRVTGLEPRVWRGGMIGYGRYAYTYASGRSGAFFMTGFAPRKNRSSVYIMPGYDFDQMHDLLARLGPHKHGKSCLHITRLDRVDPGVLEEIIALGLDRLKARYEVFDD